MDLEFLRLAAVNDAVTTIADEPRETWLTYDRWRLPEPHRRWLDTWLKQPADGAEWAFYRCRFVLALGTGVDAICRGDDDHDVEAEIRGKSELEPTMTRRKRRGPGKARRF